MRIAITGARGTVGQAVVRLCAAEGHSTVQIDRIQTEYDGTPNSEMRTADISTDYEATKRAFSGCDAVIHLAAFPKPTGIGDSDVHSNNVQTSFNGFRACGELGIKKICFASSVNAIGLVYSNQRLKFPYFPIDEEYPLNPTDSYALSKVVGETQAKSFVNWYPGTKIACLRIHAVATKTKVQEAIKEGKDVDLGPRTLWGWVHPVATARACLLSIVNADRFDGCEVFNITAPDTVLAKPSRDLVREFYPHSDIRGKFDGNKSFWDTEKAHKILGWTHNETG